ncbi:MAG: molybdopterin-dependent oxidoreductase [SAR324 cluster bacterium]|jgi:anaerobic selenocysteine-containing dehydrogenase|uniref:ArrA n=1 Tax=uncultured Pseudomonadota bacterium TaxID=153809 RepID=A0A2P0QJI7_9PROT|nr:ArrA [uncultured proteobacterium]MBP44255.1 dehydrogenase [Deltaproteobacteria bacterium]MDP6245626.1 molybdopterin-dependent oxidoreductase [SAR324 cluster bacterium]MDP7139009.1 molybdopterin-dependent oxidoreductase [SAR324 cluster bacterium]MDP7336050.1 molybdopterin-dependent oxidoreductase [SAR324 cluster bacterium]
MIIKRRNFLRGAGISGAAIAVNGPIFNSLALAETSTASENGNWLPTSCQGCTTWCPAEVFVQNGRAVKVKGNRYSKQNDGFLCAKGHLSLQQLYDPDRVKVPMKRTNPLKSKGVDPKFVPITWDEALNTIADKMMDLRKNGEPEKFMLMRGRYSYMRDTIYAALPKVFGSPNGISHSAICAEAEKFGSFFTAGNWGYRDYDLSNTKYALIWGCDPLSSNRMIPATIKRFGEMLDHGTIAVVDPKLHSSAVKAHEWLPIKPGEDGALASAIAHVLLTEGLWNKEFVGDFKDGKNLFQAGKNVDESTFAEKESHGLVKWWNIELKDKSPAWAAKITLLPEEQILRVARGMGKAAPRVVVWLGPGAAMHVRGSYSAMGIHALSGLLGSIDHEGGVLATAKIPVKGIPKFSKYQDELAKKHSKMQKIDQRGYKEFPALKKGKSGGGVVTNNAANALLTEDPYQIKVAIGYMNNFTFSCTGAERWEKAMEKIPFFAHITTNASEMTQYADIVLPSAITQYEKLGFVKTKANRFATATLILPVVKPMWDLKMDETEIPWMIAEKLKERGFSNLMDYFQKEFKDPETGKMPTNGLEFTEFNLKNQTAPLWDGKKDVGGDKISGWQEFKERGMWNSSPYKYKKRWGGKFKTVSKKFEFYSETLKKALESHAKKHQTSVDDILETANYEARGELAFVPHYETAFRHGSQKEYPFDFIDFKSKLNREGRSQNLSWYYEFKKIDVGDKSWDDVLQINPDDAAKLGIKDGDPIKVTSTVASISVNAHLWEGVRPGTVAKCFGQGHWAYGRIAAQDYHSAIPRGGSNNLLMPDEYDRLSGSTVRNGGFTGVKIEKI